MSVTLKSNSNGTAGSIQINGSDVITFDSTGKLTATTITGSLDSSSVTSSLSLWTGSSSLTTTGTLTSVTTSGNLTFSGTGNRITGDFSNATVANRVMFQTSTTNGNSRVHVIPNGTGNVSALAVLNNSDANNASWLQMAVGTTESQLNATISGTGTYLPLTFFTGGSERLRIGTSGEIGIGGANYGTSGQVLTSNGTGVAPSWQAASSTAVTMPPAVRQTVLSGNVDTNGFSSFGGSTGSTTVTSTSTLKVTSAYAADNRTGSITNPSWTGLSTNGTMYLYIDIASDGTCTTGSTTLAPVYQWGGTYSTTNTQNTFNIQEMTMKVGNGSTASQVWRTFIGEVTVAGGVVTAITWYALMGRYISQKLTPTYNTVVSANHNIGNNHVISQSVLYAKAAIGRYSIGDRISSWMNGCYSNTGYAFSGTNPDCSRIGASLNISDNVVEVQNGSGAVASVSTTSIATTFDIQFIIYRAW